MTKESRVVVRLIALWIIFIVSLGLVFWSGQQFAVSLVKISSGNYGEASCAGGYCPPAPTLSSCIMMPQYPMTSSPMGGGIGMGAPEILGPDKVAMDKYNQDYQKYTDSYAQACKEDVMRQQGVQKNSSITDIAGYAVLLVLGIIAVMVSLMAIRKSEMETVV